MKGGWLKPTSASIASRPAAKSHSMTTVQRTFRLELHRTVSHSRAAVSLKALPKQQTACGAETKVERRQLGETQHATGLEGRQKAKSPGSSCGDAANRRGRSFPSVA